MKVPKIILGGQKLNKAAESSLMTNSGKAWETRFC